MKIINGDFSPVSEELYEKIQSKYPEARNFKFSIKEDGHSYYTTTLEVRVGKKKLISKKIGENAHQSIQRAFSALKKRLEKNLQRKKFFFQFPQPKFS